MTERWYLPLKRALQRTGTPADNNFEILNRERGQEILINDTGAADTEYTVAHGLGRIPERLTIVNQTVPSGTDPVLWYRLDTDTEWNDRELYIKFTIANARVRLWIN